MDEEITKALAADLDAAFERVVRLHQDRLYSIALRVLGEPRDAEEIAQDAFIRAYRAIAGYDRDRILALQLRPWLAAIVVNLCRNRARRRKLPLVNDAPTGGQGLTGVLATLPTRDPRDSPHEMSARREAANTWAARLAELPTHYRIPVVLRHVDGMTYDEMADVLGRPQGTLKAQVHRGLAQLRAAAQRAAELEREEMTA